MVKKLLLISVIFIASCKFPYNASDVFEKKASLPKDEAPHTKNSLEWWYFTGHLEDTIKNKKLGIEYVVFHFNPTNIRGGWMVNMAVSDPENQKFYYDHKFFPKKKHEFEELPLNFNWDKKGIESSLKGQMGNYSFSAKMKEHPVSYQINTTSEKEVVLHDGTGYEEYGKYTKAGYYSYPRLASNGEITIASDTFKVSGDLWYDRQWNCSGVWERKVAWDWFSIQFEETNSELMLYRLYHIEKGEELLGGTYTDKDGRSTFLESDEIKMKEVAHWKSPDSDANYPTEWEIQVSSLQLETEVKVLFPQQELGLNFGPFSTFYYWEGMAKAKGTIRGKSVKGNSYVEMTNRFRVKD